LLAFGSASDLAEATACRIDKGIEIVKHDGGSAVAELLENVYFKLAIIFMSTL